MTDITPDHITWEEFEEQFPYGAIVFKDLQIVHVVGYTRPATEQDCMLLAEELKTDPEFQLTELSDYHITPVSGADWTKYGRLFFEG